MSTGYHFLDEVSRLHGVVVAQAAEIERLREMMCNQAQEYLALDMQAGDALARATAAEAEVERLRTLLQAVLRIAERNERGAVTDTARAALTERKPAKEQP